jgi:hypothetical protein
MSTMQPHLAGRSFTAISGIMLAATGLAKVLSSLGGAKVLAMADPITGLSFAPLMLLVGGLEVVVAGVCIVGRSPKVSLALIAWLATNFVAYRFGLWWIGWKKPCGCLGSLTDALHLSPEAADNLMKIVLAYLLIGSYVLLIRNWRRARPGDPSPPMSPGTSATSRIQV